MSEKYKDEGWLREQYQDKHRSAPEIAEECGVHSGTIYDWMDRFNIERDATKWGDKTRVPRATYYIDSQGYPRWQSKRRKKNGERGTENLHVHRLLAVAEYGVDAVAGMDVHHINGVRWDNRPSNIEVIGHAEHRAQHMTPDVVEKMCEARGDAPPDKEAGQ